MDARGDVRAGWRRGGAMRRVIAIGLGLFAAAPVAAAQICLENRSDETLLLAVEAANGQRRVASRASGQRLCLAGAARPLWCRCSAMQARSKAVRVWPGWTKPWRCCAMGCSIAVHGRCRGRRSECRRVACRYLCQPRRLRRRPPPAPSPPVLKLTSGSDTTCARSGNGSVACGIALAATKCS